MSVPCPQAQQVQPVPCRDYPVEQLLRGEGFAIPSAALLMGVQTADWMSPAACQPELEL